MASIREVANKAGVSIATVSRVMNGHHTVAEELRKRVLEAADVCEYRPNGSKRGASSVALLYMNEFLLTSPYDTACFVGMSEAMRRSPYDLVLLDMQRDRGKDEPLQQFLARKGVCGAIIRSTVEYRGILSSMATEGVPLVVLGDHFEQDALRFVYADSRSATREAVEYLLALGHREIAFVACDRDDGDHIDRMNAYREVLEAEDLYQHKHLHRVPPFRMDGAPLARRLLSKTDRPTAMFIADPLVAVGVINEAHRMGVRIPEDLSIIGFDDTDMRNMVFPRMSAVCQDSTLIGESAFEAVRQQIEAKANGEKISKPHDAWFEIHDTTGPPPIQVKSFLPGGVRLSTSS
jgi:DNA-binding LacI/PurR family transcriptional regulator